MALDWNQLIEERNAWVAHNFPDPDGSRTPLDSILGCIEEMGELTHHHLKQVQAIRGGNQFHEDEAKDAIGDLTVYLLGVMSYHKVVPRRPGYFLAVKSSDEVILTLACAVGLMAEDHKGRIPQGNMASVRIAHIVECLRVYCQFRKWDYNVIVQATWGQVKQRDWIKYPSTGLPPKPVYDQQAPIAEIH